MKRILSTGQAAELLRTTEPRLNDLIRRGKILPAPAVVSGRRLWESEHIESAARNLGVSIAEPEGSLAQEQSPLGGCE